MNIGIEAGSIAATIGVIGGIVWKLVRRSASNTDSINPPSGLIGMMVRGKTEWVAAQDIAYLSKALQSASDQRDSEFGQRMRLQAENNQWRNRVYELESLIDSGTPSPNGHSRGGIRSGRRTLPSSPRTYTKLPSGLSAGEPDPERNQRDSS